MHLLEASPVEELGSDAKVVVFSDLHLGDGSGRDEFLHNSKLFSTLLGRFYLEQGYGLVLNGDIEELLKFPIRSIVKAWLPLYEQFLQFGLAGRFWKICGNHDIGLMDQEGYMLAPWLIESLLLRCSEGSILLFHGHQASPYLNSQSGVFSKALLYLLRYVAGPAGIRNYSVSYDSRRRYATEKAVYDFSNRAGLISIIGHTHRPLFESLSKVDHLNYRIEELCRSYPLATVQERPLIEKHVDELRVKLEGCYRKGFRKSLRSGRYGNITIPSIFNSGCAIGKRGITAIELDGGMIRLVYWQKQHSGGAVATGYPDYAAPVPEGCRRIVLNEDRLDYVFARIRLLATARADGTCNEEIINPIPAIGNAV
jgi:UDP-2,3-diacylglucosamine pyrophosphatase LpxH